MPKEIVIVHHNYSNNQALKSASRSFLLLSFKAKLANFSWSVKILMAILDILDISEPTERLEYVEDALDITGRL